MLRVPETMGVGKKPDVGGDFECQNVKLRDGDQNNFKSA
jgi:hypothetical protein